MTNSYEVQKWTRILNHPDSTDAQKAEARQRLGLSDAPSPEPVAVRYNPDLDDMVRSYWGVRKMELEERHPIAETVYLDLVSVLVCGDSTPEQNGALACRLLPVLRACCSAWMKERVGGALFALVNHHQEDLADATAQAIDAALTDALPILPQDLRARIERSICAAN